MPPKAATRSSDKSTNRDEPPLASANPPREHISESEGSSSAKNRKRRARQQPQIRQPEHNLETLTNSIRDLTMSVQRQQEQINGLVRMTLEIPTLSPTQQALLRPTIEVAEPSLAPDSPPNQPRFPFDTPRGNPQKPYSELTPKIDRLGDGSQPTFAQWVATIQDRLDINADHYPSERSRQALIWGSCTGNARIYLTPRYTAESPSNQFRTTDDMIQLLRTYFETGHEQEDARQDFYNLRMGDQGYESFVNFKARFLERAINGAVAESEWFHYMWNKITPQLRDKTIVAKHSWKNSFSTMCIELLALDSELIRMYNSRKKRETSEPESSTNRYRKPFDPTSKPNTRLAVIDTKDSPEDVRG
jgi:hypothetical protein